MKEQDQPLDYNDAGVMKYLDMYQGIITRMAGNSTSCKQWAVVLVSAILAFVVRNDKTEFAWLVIIPVALFWFLDAYYLALEQQFRRAFDRVVEALHDSRLYPEHLYVVKADGKLPKMFLTAFTSWAVWPFYLFLLILLALAKLISVFLGS